jgi:hypothetical protein
MGLVAASESRADERYRTGCYLHLPGTSQVDEFGKTLVIETSSGNPFPQLPGSGVQSESDLVELPGTKI